MWYIAKRDLRPPSMLSRRCFLDNQIATSHQCSTRRSWSFGSRASSDGRVDDVTAVLFVRSPLGSACDVPFGDALVHYPHTAAQQLFVVLDHIKVTLLEGPLILTRTEVRYQVEVYCGERVSIAGVCGNRNWAVLAWAGAG